MRLRLSTTRKAVQSIMRFGELEQMILRATAAGLSELLRELATDEDIDSDIRKRLELPANEIDRLLAVPRFA